MKKLFLVLAVAGVLAACNNGGGEEVKPDSPATAPSSADTTVKPVDTTAKPTDTSAAKK